VPVLRIPDSERDVVSGLSKLSSDEVDQIAEIISRSTADWKALADALEGEVADPEGTVRALIGLSTATYDHNLDPEWTANAIRQDLADQAGEAPLERLIGNAKIRLLAKRQDICYSHERIGHQFRIFTEMRPIFNEDASDRIEAAVITHSLRIVHVKDSDFQDFYVTLDTSDLEMLRVQVERAITKTNTLRGLLESANVTLVEGME